MPAGHVVIKYKVHALSNARRKERGLGSGTPATKFLRKKMIVRVERNLE